MGDVVPFRPRSVSNSPPTKVEEGVPTTLIEGLIGLHVGFGAHTPPDVTTQLVKMEMFLDHAGHIRSESVVLRRQLLRPNTLLELYDLVRESRQQEWLSHPAYYRALADEIRSRQ